MPPLAWLMITLVFGAAAIGFARPAWRSYRARASRDLNTERYRAWRGQTVRGQPAPRAGVTAEERRRIYGALALAGIALIALVAFFLAT